MSTDRSYSSALRNTQALETRRRIRTAARRLFSEQGFTSTTIAEIAAAAGVSAATVYAAFESKAGIVVAMLEDLEEDAEVGPQLDALHETADPYTQLRAFVAAHCRLFVQGADILRAALRAVEDPHVAALAEAGDGHRRSAIERLTSRWAEAGALRDELSAEEAAERLWLLTTVEGYLNAVDRLGWDSTVYERWLAEVAEREILRPLS